jgi:hypothetical protein
MRFKIVSTLYFKVLLMKEKETSPLETLSEIRHLMERSSRFISLSGLSGVFAGVYALIGAYAAYSHLDLKDLAYFSGAFISDQNPNKIDNLTFVIADACIVLVLAIGTGIFLTTRKAEKDGNSIFDMTAKKMVVNLCIPLITGGIFCLALIYNHILVYVPPAMLIFYGLALINASHYTRPDIRVMGFTEILLGLIALFFLGYGFLFWVVGFGIMHIIYGAYMYFKYEK